ncbi:hypothetical protein DCC85_01250 [Paenibacillus sp. CAA11]|uniref:LytTR family DNA-binding domain-containing protein n=1 Tax=Paenibacillus sp. CAA11 TaxID=1532905 RepID=UPI000D3D1A34|nr:LytTR family DNA-binding domain-containing protein [Paenibacillus sp. CAA11]AWB42990.1 hypothetical protein DCC85_01250 [Paenibacillus sp. CAA11]
MQFIFEADPGMDQGTARVTTHPQEKAQWGSIKEAISQTEKKIIAIRARNNRQIPLPVSSIAVIQSEDRMCCVRVITGEMYLIPKRLKFVEEDLSKSCFLKINNQTVINTRYIKEFSSTEHARIEVTLKDGTSYLVSRHYIKKFRGSLT